MKERVEGLVAQFPDKELDGILISAAENRRYLSGFSGSAGYLFITKDKAVLVTDSRYTEQATNQSPSFDVRQVRGGGVIVAGCRIAAEPFSHYTEITTNHGYIVCHE